jgi:uncharacterized membrane protein (DUF2068 family)
MAEVQKRAPTLYAIIVIKLAKGLLFLGSAMWIWTMADENLVEEFRGLLNWCGFDPERKFFSHLLISIGAITPHNIHSFAAGTALYSVFALVEGVGLMFRISWAGWMAIGESLFFIPLEIRKLVHEFSLTWVIILVLNIGIAWYLLQNRHRLFHHFRAHHAAPAAAPVARDVDVEI